MRRGSIRAGKNAMRIKSVSIRFAREETKTKKTPSVSRRGESSVARSLTLSLSLSLGLERFLKFCL